MKILTQSKAGEQNRLRWTVAVGHLRDQLATSSECQLRFDEAADLWLSLFETHADRYPSAAFATSSLKRSRCEEVERFLDWIIYGTRSGTAMAAGSFVPTPREALLVLTAAWLFPLGMKFGLFESERLAAADPESVRCARTPKEEELEEALENYHERTARYIREQWHLNCRWSPEDRELLARLCVAQRPGIPLESLPTILPEELRTADDGVIKDDTHLAERNPRNVNLRKLAALLRLANVLRLSAAFCPPDLARRLKPADMNMAGGTRWYSNLVKLVEGVDLRHGANTIALKVWRPEPVDLMTHPGSDGRMIPLLLEAGPLLEYVRLTLQGIVNEVAPCLNLCESTRLNRVEVEDQDNNPCPVNLSDLLHEVWPMMLATTSCATEGACCFGLILDRAIQDELSGRNGDVPLIDKLRNKISVLRSVQPFNAMSRRLADQVERICDTVTGKTMPARAIQQIQTLVHDFLAARARCCEVCAQEGSRLLAGLDAIVLYGFSRNVFAAIRQSGFQGQVFYIPIRSEVRRPEINSEIHPAESGENARVVQWFKTAMPSLSFRSISLDEIPLAIESAATTPRDRDRNVAFLVGTRAVLTDSADGQGAVESCLCSVGNRTIALAVRNAGGWVLVVGEKGKRCNRTESQSLINAISKASLDQSFGGRVDRLIQGEHFDESLIPE